LRYPLSVSQKTVKCIAVFILLILLSTSQVIAQKSNGAVFTTTTSQTAKSFKSMQDTLDKFFMNYQVFSFPALAMNRYLQNEDAIIKALQLNIDTRLYSVVFQPQAKS